MTVRLDVSALDYTILAIYFAVVLGIGAVARLAIKTDIDFFLSGRSLPAWITGLVTFFTAPKPESELRGLVWGLPREDVKSDAIEGDSAWFRSPWILGAGAIALVVILNIIFI